jgi:cytochrome c553
MILRRPVSLTTMLVSLTLLGGFVGDAVAAGSSSAGQGKATTCIACHGVDGNSVNPEWPNLAGQHSSYIVKQLKAFKGGVRKNPLMSPMAQPLSDQDIEDLAAYYSSQTAKGLEADKSKYQAGEKLYRGGNGGESVPACIACHGPNGRGNEPAAYPSIRGQHSKYVEMQLTAYKAGDRETDQAQNQMMRDTAKRLSSEEIAAVAAYVQGLR